VTCRDPTKSLSICVLGSSFAVALATGIVFGMVPAMRASANDVTTTLGQSRRTGLSRERQRLLAGLVAAEIALAVVLVIGAGLLIRSLSQLLQVDPGFRSDNLLSAVLAPPGIRYSNNETRRAFFTEVQERLEALPGTRAVAVATLCRSVEVPMEVFSGSRDDLIPHRRVIGPSPTCLSLSVRNTSERSVCPCWTAMASRTQTAMAPSSPAS
jgi:hypothetical protein